MKDFACDFMHFASPFWGQVSLSISLCKPEVDMCSLYTYILRSNCLSASSSSKLTLGFTIITKLQTLQGFVTRFQLQKGSLHVCSKDDVEGLDLATALELLKWPVVLGDAPSREAVLLARGKYGFYVQQGELRAPIRKVCLLPYGTTRLQHNTSQFAEECPACGLPRFCHAIQIAYLHQHTPV